MSVIALTFVKFELSSYDAQEYDISIKDLWYCIWPNQLKRQLFLRSPTFGKSANLSNLCKLRVIELKFCVRMH